MLDIWRGPRVVGLYRKGWGTNQYWQWHEYGNKMVSKWTGVSNDHLENCLAFQKLFRDQLLANYVYDVYRVANIGPWPGKMGN